LFFGITVQPLEPRALTAIHRHVAAARAGREPRVIARLASGWALLGERQFLRGYALLLPDPVVPTLNALGAPQRAQFLSDMGLIGDALLSVTDAVRINYAMFGNLEPALHAHVIPRYDSEAEDLRVAQPWAYDRAQARAFDVRHDTPLLESLRAALAAANIPTSQ
jgi:diadenosine tetraphosphate (Ap4A) HIT family hydrolase